MMISNANATVVNKLCSLKKAMKRLALVSHMIPLQQAMTTCGLDDDWL